MSHVKYIILGAGPSGLTLANILKERGENSFLVIEKEAVAGGLCRSVWVDGAPFDIGGGHFLDIRRPIVTEFLFKFMPIDEWNLFNRDSQISVNGSMVSHPLEANIWQFDESIQKEYLESIKNAGCNTGSPMPDKFVDWIFWKLGDKISNDYMIPYNQKMFANELNELGTYWLEKLPNVSFEDTQKSCEEHKAYGQQPGHASFYYPKKYGYGEVFLRMADNIKENIVYNAEASELNISDKAVTFNSETVYADNIIVTVPWNSFREIIGLPEHLLNGIKKLKSSAIETRYVNDTLDTNAQWIYYPDSSLPYHRILVRHNFCPNSRGYWYETRKERVPMFKEDAAFSYINEYAYPLNTIEKPLIMDSLLKFLTPYHVYGLGRWGEHNHYNSDVVIEKAILLAEKI
ncbi:MAG: FAD-dependent oxidoreductase [Lachnospiraceae bacterium]|nr:FAD-dependent oxidoreductase [Lachnospiraceae bacterium]